MNGTYKKLWGSHKPLSIYFFFCETKACFSKLTHSFCRLDAQLLPNSSENTSLYILCEFSSTDYVQWSKEIFEEFQITNQLLEPEYQDKVFIATVFQYRLQMEILLKLRFHFSLWKIFNFEIACLLSLSLSVFSWATAGWQKHTTIIYFWIFLRHFFFL